MPLQDPSGHCQPVPGTWLLQLLSSHYGLWRPMGGKTVRVLSLLRAKVKVTMLVMRKDRANKNLRSGTGILTETRSLWTVGTDGGGAWGAGLGQDSHLLLLICFSLLLYNDDEVLLALFLELSHLFLGILQLQGHHFNLFPRLINLKQSCPQLSGLVQQLLPLLCQQPGVKVELGAQRGWTPREGSSYTVSLPSVSQVPVFLSVATITLVRFLVFPSWIITNGFPTGLCASRFLSPIYPMHHCQYQLARHCFTTPFHCLRIFHGPPMCSRQRAAVNQETQTCPEEWPSFIPSLVGFGGLLFIFVWEWI